MSQTLGLFQDSDFAGDLEDSKSTSGGILCLFGSRTFVRVKWMCKKQTSVSHSSTEFEINSLDAGLRMDGLLALDLWDIVIQISRSLQTIKKLSIKASGNRSKIEASGNGSKITENGQHPVICNKENSPKIDQLSQVDHVPSKAHSSQGDSKLYIFEDNEAVIKMIIKGRSPTMRHVSRTHRVALDWLSDRINVDPEIQIRYVDTKNQLADILTKGCFSKDELEQFASFVAHHESNHVLSQSFQSFCFRSFQESETDVEKRTGAKFW